MNPRWCTGPRTGRARQPLTRWSGSPPCLPVRVRTQTGVPMFPERASRWCASTDTAATCVGGNGRTQMRTDWSPASCRSRNQPKSTARTGQDLPATGGLIQKIYELDPLTCPKCQGKMRIIAFIEDPEIVKKIIKHLALYGLRKQDRDLKRMRHPWLQNAISTTRIPRSPSLMIEFVWTQNIQRRSPPDS